MRPSRTLKGSQTDAVIVPLPYGQTELCPVRALAAWQKATRITVGPVFRRIWLPKKGVPGECPPLPRIGSQPITCGAVAAIVAPRRPGWASGILAGIA